MDKVFLDNFNNIISYISPRIQIYLKNINESTIMNIQEVRIRSNRPIIIVTHTGSWFLNKSGKLSLIFSQNCVVASENEIYESINKMCRYSMHSHYEDLLNGYITLPNGSRVGITGTAVYDKNNVKGIKDIDGINIRIPRQIQGVSDSLFNTILNSNLSSLLIVGPPSSGKTTMLKDLIFQLSSGRIGKYYKICVIDERKEIVTSKKDMSTIGPNTDVLYGFPKSQGISMAVRTLSPDIIICDEVDSEEINSIIDVMNTGVKFILSVHAGNFNELKEKRFYKLILKNKCIDYIVILKGNNNPCKISEIKKINGDVNENSIDTDNSNFEHFNYFELYEENQTSYKSS